MARWKEAPRVTVVEGSPIPDDKLEALKQLITKVALRKLKEMQPPVKEAA
jgi:hypothetical protein